MAPTTKGASRAPRSDARDNRRRLLDAADEVFGDQGADASLEEVARRAGVGIGTLYRHFPTRKELLDAMLREGIDALEHRARQLADAGEDDAFVLWLRGLRDHTARYRGLAATLMVDLLDETSTIAATCESMTRAATALLHAEQTRGSIRSDVTMADAVVLVNAAAWSADQPTIDAEQARRVFDFMMDALRP